MTPGAWVVVGVVGGLAILLLGIGLKAWSQRQTDDAANKSADDQLDADRHRADAKVIELDDREALREAREAFGRKKRQP